VVPRGGIELSSMILNSRHFWNGDFPVYPRMYPAFSSHADPLLHPQTGSAGPFAKAVMTALALGIPYGSDGA
jgi:hypothetical protein